MWWAGSRRCDLYLGAALSSHRGSDGTAVAQAHDDLRQCLPERMSQAVGASKRWSSPGLRVWLSGALARPFLVELPEGLKGNAEALLFAKARVGEETGFGAACELWMESGAPGSRQLAVAVESATRDAIWKAARDQRIQLLSVRPWWAGALDQMVAGKPDLRLFVARDSDATLVLTAEGDRWESAESCLPQPTEEQLDSLIARRKFAAGIDEAASARVCFRSALEPGDQAKQGAALKAWPPAVTVEAFAR